MPARYTIDTQQRLIWSSYDGALTDDVLLGHDERLREDPSFDPGYSHLADFTAAGDVSVTPDGLRKLAQLSPFAPTIRRAIVAPQAVVYGLARMFQVFNPRATAQNHRIFATVPEASAWLGVERPDPVED
jgi:hypothetical protein